MEGTGNDGMQGERGPKELAPKEPRMVVSVSSVICVVKKQCCRDRAFPPA
jgi:hypothetical protein